MLKKCILQILNDISQFLNKNTLRLLYFIMKQHQFSFNQPVSKATVEN